MDMICFAYCLSIDELSKANSSVSIVINSNDADDGQRRYLTLDIVSSQLRVSVSVDGAAVRT